MSEELLKSLEAVLTASSARLKAYEVARKLLLAGKTALRRDDALALSAAVTGLKKVDPSSLGIGGFAEVVAKLDDSAKEAMRTAAFKFTSNLRQTFSDAKTELTGGPGRFSSQGFVIEVDERSASVSILYGKEPVIPKPLPLDATKVLKAHASAVKSVARGRMKDSEFLAKLFDAYNRVIRQEKRELGDRINIMACFREFVFVRQSAAFRTNPLRANFAEYPKWRFAYDLGEVRKAGGHGGYQLQLAPPTIHESDKSKLLWLPSSADEGTYIADTWWRNERNVG